MPWPPVIDLYPGDNQRDLEDTPKSERSRAGESEEVAALREPERGVKWNAGRSGQGSNKALAPASELGGPWESTPLSRLLLAPGNSEPLANVIHP